MPIVVIASIVWILTFGSAIRLIVERARGVRFLAPLRSAMDRMVLTVQTSFGESVPAVNRLFFRQLFHYLVHIFLSRVLKFLQWGERRTHSIVRFNRKKAVVSASVNPESHLQKVAAHKEESALTSAEKKERKAAALRG